MKIWVPIVVISYLWSYGWSAYKQLEPRGPEITPICEAAHISWAKHFQKYSCVIWCSKKEESVLRDMEDEYMPYYKTSVD